MSSFDYFSYLATTTAEFLVLLGFVSLPLLLFVFFATLHAVRRKDARRWRVLLASLAPTVIPIALLLVGVACVRPADTSRPAGVHAPIPWFPAASTHHAVLPLEILMWLSLPLAFALAWWATRRWPAAVAAMLWWGWISFCAAGTAQMSVSGLWL